MGPVGALNYDVERLTPGMPVVEHLEAVQIETDGPWLIVRAVQGPDGGEVIRCWPETAIVEVRLCRDPEHGK